MSGRPARGMGAVATIMHQPAASRDRVMHGPFHHEGTKDTKRNNYPQITPITQIFFSRAGFRAGPGQVLARRGNGTAGEAGIPDGKSRH
ncbi:hypothetical protein [Thioalbus denitrificans]|uniref:hypothetical protein n=1 Tax=Thioalbus denitrificans TaxID=547122 RepID=UPI0011C07FAB|nr:hypothetical protein [Thioalbus denitrificans]